MKSKFFLSLMLASTFSSGFATESVSTLAQRDAMIKKAFEKSPEDAIKFINEEQQADKTKADDQHYVVIVKKDGDKYVRVAHFKKDKVNIAVEQSIMNIILDAEAKLASTSGPVSFSFSAGAGEKKLYAILSKHGDYLIFNICPTSEEVDGLLKANQKTEDKKPEETVPTAEIRPADKPAEVTPTNTASESSPTKKPEESKTEVKATDKSSETTSTPTETKKTEDKKTESSSSTEKAAAPAT